MIHIPQQLGMSNTKWFITSFNRSNLQYEVHEKKGKQHLNEIIELIKRQWKKQSGIIYCLSQKETEDVASELECKGIRARAYHAGLSNSTRTGIQENWIRDKVEVICATIAFGMGIDKPDVRFVIHFSIPKSIENYYQESGRAGRDGQKSTCILYYSNTDVFRMKSLQDKALVKKDVKEQQEKNLEDMVNYCESSSECRRMLQLKYLGEVFDPSLCNSSGAPCDNCRKSNHDVIDISDFARQLVEMVTRLSSRAKNFERNFTTNHLVDILRGSKNKAVMDRHWNTDTFYKKGLEKGYSQSFLQRIIRKLIQNKYLREENTKTVYGVTAYIKRGENAEKIKENKFEIDVEKKHKEKVTTIPKKVEDVDDFVIKSIIGPSKSIEYIDYDKLKEISDECFANLKNAIAMNFPDLKSAYLAFPIECFREMSKKLPQTKSEMLEIEQMTEYRFEKYGSYLIKVCQEYNEKRLDYLKGKEVPIIQAKKEEVTKTIPVENEKDKKVQSAWMSKSTNSVQSSSDCGKKRPFSATESQSTSNSNSKIKPVAKKPNVGWPQKARPGVVRGNFKL